MTPVTKHSSLFTLCISEILDNINIIKHFSSPLILRVNKLERFFLESLFGQI